MQISRTLTSTCLESLQHGPHTTGEGGSSWPVGQIVGNNAKIWLKTKADRQSCIHLFVTLMVSVIGTGVVNERGWRLRRRLAICDV